MKIGIDIIDLKQFAKSLAQGGQSFLNKNFSPEELKDMRNIHLAGLFAAKEALFKAGVIKYCDLGTVQILKTPEGRPFVADIQGKILSGVDISISHQNETVVAVAINNK